MRNERFYVRVEMGSEDKVSFLVSRTYWWMYVLIVTPLIFIVSFFSGRFTITCSATSKTHFYEVIDAIIVVIMVSMPLAWVLVLKPLLNKKKGYNLKGQFVVEGKYTRLGLRTILLHPGTNHKVVVDRLTFARLKRGDKVSVERRALGDLVKIKKIDAQ